MLTLLTALTLFAVPQLTAEPRSPANRAVAVPDQLFLPATDSLIIPARSPGEGEWTYRDLWADYLTVTDQRAVFSIETHLELEAISSTLESRLVVPPERVQSTVEALLALEDFAIAFPSGDGPARLLRLLSLRENDELLAAKNAARQVSIADLERLQHHPAVIVECVISAGAFDVSPLAKNFRRSVELATARDYIAVGESGTALVQGRGSEVAHFVAAVQTASGEPTAWYEFLRPSDVEVQPTSVLALPQLGHGYSLLDFFHDYEERTGVHLQLSDSDRRAARKTSVGGHGTYSVQPSELHSVFEDLLLIHGYTTLPITSGEERILGLRQATGSSQATFPTALSNRVSPADLDAWRAYPSLTLRATLQLESTGHVEFLQIVRGRIPTSNYERFLPFGVDGFMDVIAPGSVLTKLHRVLEEVGGTPADPVEGAGTREGTER